jgi:hypothetical protein
VIAFCEAEGIDYVFGLPTNAVLCGLVESATDDLRVRRAEAQASVLRHYAETGYRARSWSRERRVVARIEASSMGLDIRFVVTSFARGSAEWVYDGLHCARGQAENLIKLHKAQLASDCTSCRSPLATRVRHILHTAAYWLLLALRDRISRPHPLAGAEFATLRLHLLKLAGRVIETASRVRIAFRRLPARDAVPQPRPQLPSGWSMTDGASAPRAFRPATSNAACPSPTSLPHAIANLCPDLNSACRGTRHHRPLNRTGQRETSCSGEDWSSNGSRFKHYPRAV